MPAGSQWPHSIVICLRNVNEATLFVSGSRMLRFIAGACGRVNARCSALRLAFRFARVGPFHDILRTQLDLAPNAGACASPAAAPPANAANRRAHPSASRDRPRDHPARRRVARERKRPRKCQQRFLAARQAVFMRVAHRQFARAAIDRIAPAQDGVVGLADRAPQAALLEQRDDVILVASAARACPSARPACRDT